MFDLHTGTQVNIPDSRYQVDYHPQNHTYTLTIEKVRFAVFSILT